MLLAGLVLLMVPSVVQAAPTRADTTLRVMTFNIRYNNPGDGAHAWPHRKERVASVIRFHQADFVGMQEALQGQIDDLEGLLPGYAWIGVGRDDGAAAGEFSPLFYRRARFELLEQATFWLSETPEVPGSQSWDAALPRIVTWGRFRDREAGTTFFVFNTHFDHRGQQAREESARLLAEKIRTIAGNTPVLVTGDFNAEPTTPVFRTMVADLADARAQSALPPHGPDGTLWGFTVEVDEPERRIDYIFVSPSVRVRRYAALTDHWNGHFPSDHIPILAEVAF